MTFNFSGVKLNWFPGHMATGLKKIRSRIQNEIDLIIEVRDARIPFSSANCEMILGSNAVEGKKLKKKIVVFTKSDLAEEEENERLKQHFRDEGIVLCKDDKRD